MAEPRLKGSNPFAGCPPLQVRIKREGPHTRPRWYAYITYAVPVPRVKPGAAAGVLGLDRNVGQSKDSEDVVYPMTDQSRLEAKIRRKQREKVQKQTASVRGRRIGG